MLQEIKAVFIAEHVQRVKSKQNKIVNQQQIIM